MTRRIIGLILSFQVLTGCDTPVSNVAACGDGVLDPGEQCDGAALGVTTCQDLGFYEQLGVLTCKADCTIDTARCASRCGDFEVQADFGETCDGDDFGGATCESLGLGEGALVCDAACHLDTSGCEITSECGDLEITDPVEVCDGTNLDGQSCLSLGYNGGTLACLSDCTGFDLTSCEASGRCGDGVIQEAAGEECEGTDVGGHDCTQLGFYLGVLRCQENCRFDTAGCSGYCGDGVVQGYYNEVCDGTELDGNTCQTLGYYGGDLVCSPSCMTFNENVCQLYGWCGDDVIQTSEVCDGTQFGGQTCISLGFQTGSLSCVEDCGRIDTSSCILDCDTDQYCGPTCMDCTLINQICRTDGTGCVQCNEATDCPNANEFCYLVDHTCQPDCSGEYATVFTVGGGADVCAGGGAEITLSGSQVGRVYQLYRDGAALGGLFAGTGGVLNFGQQTQAGTYTVAAVNQLAGCIVQMTGQAVLGINAAPTAVTGQVDHPAVCTGTGVIFSAATHTGGACSGGQWEYEWRTGPSGTGTVVKTWSTDSTHTQVVNATATFYLRMRCSLCVDSISPSSPAVRSVIPACSGTCSVCSDGACVANQAACVGNCDTCSGGDTTFNCVANQAACTGNCDTCVGGGNAFNCAQNPSDCLGNCSACTGGDTEFNCSANEDVCTGNCDTCSGGGTSFSCIADQAACTGNCDTCTGGDTSYSCMADPAQCTGNCDQCTGSGTSFSCSANAAACSGNCATCSGGGTQFDCAANSAACTAPATCEGADTTFNCSGACVNGDVSTDGCLLGRCKYCLGGTWGSCVKCLVIGCIPGEIECCGSDCLTCKLCNSEGVWGLCNASVCYMIPDRPLRIPGFEIWEVIDPFIGFSIWEEPRADEELLFFQ